MKTKITRQNNIQLYIPACAANFAGNPIAIAAIPQLQIPRGSQSGSRPILAAFISGSPAPTRDNITWYFNNGEDLPSGIIRDGSELVLPSVVPRELAGDYTVQVTTSRGTARDTFEVIVTSELQ